MRLAWRKKRIISTSRKLKATIFKLRISEAALFATVLIFGTLAVGTFVFGWTSPASNPPNGNVGAPLNTGSGSQTKTGSLSIGGTLSVTGTTTVTGPVSAVGGFYERSRSALMGEWIDQSFSAGDYVGGTGLTLTVDSGDVAQNRYALVGKTLIWNIYLQSMTVSGSSNMITIRIPGGYTAAKGQYTGPMIGGGNSGFWLGQVYSGGVGSNFIQVLNISPGGNLSTGSNQLSAWGTLVLEVQ